MTPEQALQLVIGILQRAPISQLEAIGIEQALNTIKDAIKPEDGENP